MVHASRRQCFVFSTGQSTRAYASRFCGWTDPPISSDGVARVTALGHRFREEGVNLPRIWYVSDRRRAISTFEILTAGMHAPVVRLTDTLREMNFGSFENLAVDELPEDFLRQYDAARANPMNLKFPGGETFRDFCERVSAGALEILSYDEDTNDVGIIGHQGSVRLWMMMAEGQGPEAFFDQVVESGTCHRLRLTPQDIGQWRRRHLAVDGGMAVPAGQQPRQEG